MEKQGIAAVATSWRLPTRYTRGYHRNVYITHVVTTAPLCTRSFRHRGSSCVVESRASLCESWNEVLSSEIKMEDKNESFSAISLNSSLGCGDLTMSEGLVQSSPKDELIASLREEKTQLEHTVEKMDAHIDKLEIQLCKLRNGLLPEQDEGDEEWLQMHFHCTSSTCWRQKYAESMMQLRAALVEVKNELEKQPHKGPDAAAKASDLRAIEESLRSLGPVLPPVRNLKRSSTGAGPQQFKSPRLAPSDSQTSIARRPFLKRMINIFRRNNASTQP